MAWYDVFANFYDASLDGIYREHRVAAARAMALSPGMRVADVGCGTGASFPALEAAVSPTGQIHGIDASPGMLKKASARARRNGWSNVQLLDARALPADAQSAATHVDAILFFLSASVIPDYTEVLDQWLDRLVPGGRLVVADVHNPNPGLYARFVERIAQADIRRTPWTHLEERCGSVQLDWQPSSWVLGGRFYLAMANKRH
jgi:ubiquinone/menaquinone biosynthesis C-methylase UbiE